MYQSLIKLIALSVCMSAAALAVAEVPDGALLYQQNCAVCHGAEGAGGVGVPLKLPDFLAVASDDYIKKSIRLGRPGRVMPAFSSMSDAHVEALVAYIRGLSAEPAPVYDSRVIEGQADKGKLLFASHCAACHGDSGQGASGTGVTLSRPREAPVMAPALNNTGFQQAVSDAMLKQTLLRGREGTPMPSIKALGLKQQDADDLVAYLRTLEDAERGETDSGPQPVIQFESSYDLEQTLENLKQAVVGRNFRIIRLQHLEEGLAKPGEENPHTVMLYFCNFAFLNEALAIDPRVGLFLPCRVTVMETEHGVQVMSINPKNLSRLFNNRELDKACQQMHDLYVEIIEEATL